MVTCLYRGHRDPHGWGGALKLEATHLKRLPVPRLSDKDIEKIESLENFDTPPVLDVVDEIIVDSVLHETTSKPPVWDMIQRLREFIKNTEQSRQRGNHGT